MDPFDYCRDRAAPVGSTLYYCLLFSPREAAARQCAVYAFARELEAAAIGWRDREPALHKLAWWANEVSRLGREPAAHPVSIALGGGGGPAPGERERMLRMVAACDRLVREGTADREALWRYCGDTHGSAAVLLAAAAGGAGEETARRAADLGTATGLAEVVCSLGGWQTADPGLLPRREAQRGGVDAARLERPEADAALIGLLDALHAHAATTLEAVLGPAASGPHGPPLCEVARARIARAGLARGRARLGKRTPRPAGVPPLRKLWIAWRTARQGRRTAPGAMP